MLSPITRATALSSGKALGSISQRAAAPMMWSKGFSTTAPGSKKAAILLQDKANGFGFARSNPRPKKPRSQGVTEIRGPYYTVRAG
jgi:hypothetical protein